jgi:hypothetical protein
MDNEKILPDPEPRKKVIGASVTVSERRDIELAAFRLGFRTRSEYARSVLLDHARRTINQAA